MKLPPEIIIKIIIFLNSEKDIKSCMCLSKSIRQMCLHTPELMRKLKVRISENYLDALPFIQRYGHTFMNVKIEKLTVKTEDSFFNLFESIPNVEKLKISDSCVESCNIRKRRRNIYLHDSPISKKTIKNENASDSSFINNKSDIKFKNLTVLEVNDLSDNLFEIICEYLREKNNLKIFVFKNFNIKSSNQNCINLITQQTNLKSLEILGNFNMQPMLQKYLEKTKPNFALQKFITDEKMEFNDNIYFFFKGQVNLVKLKLGGYNLNIHYLKLIFDELRQLKEFSLEKLCQLSDESIIELESYQQKSIQVLEITGCDNHSRTFCTFLNIFKNLHTLRLGELIQDSGSHFYSGINIFDNLASLFIYDFSTQHLQLSNLKTLKIENLIWKQKQKTWEDLMKNCPNIEILQVHSIEDSKKSNLCFENLFQSLKLLKKLKIFKLDKQVNDFNIEINSASKCIKIRELTLFLKTVTNLKQVFNDFKVIMI